MDKVDWDEKSIKRCETCQQPLAKNIDGQDICHNQCKQKKGDKNMEVIIEVTSGVAEVTKKDAGVSVTIIDNDTQDENGPDETYYEEDYTIN
ncbi:MAG TPA: hypothetical protein VMW50_08225 [Dehalococcoidia bacterium]|nr:hypothetical protein [Dehalococcoidia bacterium]